MYALTTVSKIKVLEFRKDGWGLYQCGAAQTLQTLKDSKGNERIWTRDYKIQNFFFAAFAHLLRNMDSYICVVAAAVISALVLFLLKIATVVWWKPLQIKSYFERQGIRGPPYTLLYGNAPDIVQMMKQTNATPMPLSHHIIPRVLPHHHRWTQTYGRDFLFWFGPKARLNVAEPELIKEMVCRIERPKVDTAQENHQSCVSYGIIEVESSANMLEEWSKSVSAGNKEIEVHKELRDLTADVIARTAFGSSYIEGNNIFNMQSQQMLLASELFRSVYIPGFRFLPTKKNRQRWKLEKEIRMGIRQLIEGREKAVGVEKSSSYGSDLLGLMMTTNSKQVGGSQEDLSMTLDEIIDECKTFYFAGHETSSNLLTWAMILLGMHQDWQERGRREVMEVCGKDAFPNADTVNRLKIVGMILNEALRLYPPVVMLSRQTNKSVKLGRLAIPAGTQFLLPVLAIHHDPDLWGIRHGPALGGADASEFNPERFAEGIAKAVKHPMAFMPFGAGPRICIGQNFALLEAKTLMAYEAQRCLALFLWGMFDLHRQLTKHKFSRATCTRLITSYFQPSDISRKMPHGQLPSSHDRLVRHCKPNDLNDLTSITHFFVALDVRSDYSEQQGSTREPPSS
eukprot:Gb_13156 [translate_table: standard]